jgi:hypothetical protein
VRAALDSLRDPRVLLVRFDDDLRYRWERSRPGRSVLSDESSSRGVGQGPVLSDEDVPQDPPMPSSDDLMRMFAASGVAPAPPPSRWSLRSKLIGAILFAGIGVGASAMSCVGQSFSFRQARALEGIEQQLLKIQLQMNCPAVPREGS